MSQKTWREKHDQDLTREDIVAMRRAALDNEATISALTTEYQTTRGVVGEWWAVAHWLSNRWPVRKRLVGPWFLVGSLDDVIDPRPKPPPRPPEDSEIVPLVSDDVSSCRGCNRACWWPRCPAEHPEQFDGDTIVRGGVDA